MASTNDYGNAERTPVAPPTRFAPNSRELPARLGAAPLTREQWEARYATRLQEQDAIIRAAVQQAMSEGATQEEVVPKWQGLMKLIQTTQNRVLRDNGAAFYTEVDFRDPSVSPTGGRVRFELAGSCAGCALTKVTIEEGISAAIRQQPALNWITDFGGSVDRDMSKPENQLQGTGDFRSL